MKNIFYISLVVLSVICACSSAEVQRSNILNDGWHHIRYYSFTPASDIVSRIQPMPQKQLEMLKQLDNRSDYEAYMPAAQELELFKKYLNLLPPLNRKTMKDTTIAIYFVKNFMGAGMADSVAGENNEVYTLLFINPEVMKQTVSQWITYRESSSFKKTDNDVSLLIDCGASYKALLYLLIHESSHIVDYVHHVTPYVDDVSAAVFGKQKNSAFTAGVWDSYDRPAAAFRVQDADKLIPYGFAPATVPDVHMKTMYENLMKTPFVSLYGSRIWAEDFADASAFYFLTQKMNQPYVVSVFEKKKKVFTCSPEENTLVRARWKNLEFLYSQ